MNTYKSVSEFPSYGELFKKNKCQLQRNIVDGSYESVKQYLQIQYTLLREDFMRPLREALWRLRNNVNDVKQEIWIYENVQILTNSPYNFGEKLAKNVFYARFSMPKSVQEFDWKASLIFHVLSSISYAFSSFKS